MMSHSGGPVKAVRTRGADTFGFMPLRNRSCRPVRVRRPATVRPQQETGRILGARRSRRTRLVDGMLVVFRLKPLANLHMALAGGHAGAQLPEEALESGGCNQTEKLGLRSELEPVAGVARHEDQGARLGSDRLMPDSELNSALEDVEELVAVDVDVGWRPVAFGPTQLEDLEGVASLLAGNSEDGPTRDKDLALTGGNHNRNGTSLHAHQNPLQ